MALYNLFNGVPSIGPDADTTSVSLGTEFVVTAACWVTQIRWFKPFGGTSNIRVGGLYKVSGSSGSLVVGPVNIPNPEGGTWGAADVPPYRLEVGGRYRAVIFHPGGRYPASGGYFTTGPGASNIVRGPVTVPNAANSAAQGAYTYSESLVYPVETYNGGAYFSDITITDVDPNPVEDTRASVGVRTEGGWVTERAKVSYLNEDRQWTEGKLKYWTGSGWSTP